MTWDLKFMLCQYTPRRRS